MVNTAISDIASDICQNAPEGKKIGGLAATDVYPGQYVIMASGKWTLIDSDTAAHKLLKGGVVDYRRRKNDADATPTIDQAYDINAEPIDDYIEVWVDGICAVFIDDPVATYYPGIELIASATAGNVKVRAQEATGATSGTAYRSAKLGTLARKIVSGDTKAFIAMGRSEGRFY